MKLKTLSPALILLAAACSAETSAETSAPAAPEAASAQASEAASVISVDAPSGTYANDPTHTSLIWRVNHLGLSNYAARMNDVKITLEFDADNFAASSVKATINPLSVDTGYPGEKDFDGEIASSSDFLNAEQFPAIEFASKEITVTGADQATITGDLTLLGVTKEVTLEAMYSGSTAEHFFAKKPAIGFMAKGAFDRTEFGLDHLSGKGVGDNIEIVITAEFIKQ